MTLEQAIEKYGKTSDGHWEEESKFCTMLEVPSPLCDHMINVFTGGPTHHIYVNKDLYQPLLNVFLDICAAGLSHLIETFDGCLMIRDVRGEPGHPSTHCYALAIDLNAKSNRLGTDGDMDLRIVNIFKSHGFAWGGDFKRKDCMHFSLAWE